MLSDGCFVVTLLLYQKRRRPSNVLWFTAFSERTTFKDINNRPTDLIVEDRQVKLRGGLV